MQSLLHIFGSPFGLWVYYEGRGFHYVEKGVLILILMVIFGLIAILGILSVIKSLKKRNYLGFIFAAGTAAVFGWFAVMTIINSGFPVAH